MNPKVLSAVWHWGKALLSACVKGAATSLTTFLTTAGLSAAGVNVQALNLRQAGWICAGSALFAAATFLSKHPLPEEDDLPAQAANPETK